MRGDEAGLGTRVLENLAARCLYPDRIENTYGRRQVIGRIEAFRAEVVTRLPRAYPH